MGVTCQNHTALPGAGVQTCCPGQLVGSCCLIVPLLSLGTGCVSCPGQRLTAHIRHSGNMSLGCCLAPTSFPDNRQPLGGSRAGAKPLSGEVVLGKPLHVSEPLLSRLENRDVDCVHLQLAGWLARAVCNPEVEGAHGTGKQFRNYNYDSAVGPSLEDTLGSAWS